MKVETQSQNWSSKLRPQPEGERVISAAAWSFGAMFSYMCFFCSGDLPVPLSPSLKRNIFKITVRPLRGQSKKARAESSLALWGLLEVRTSMFWKVLPYPVLAAALAGCHFIWLPSQVWDPELLSYASYTEERAGSQTPTPGLNRSPHFCPAPDHSSCTGREPDPGFTFSRVL